jgi:hypothetical protein
MNSVPDELCSLDPSIVSSFGTPNSMSKVLSAWPASTFVAIGYISARKVPFENTWAYLLPSCDLHRPSIVSDAHIPSIFFLNILSALYCLASGIIAYLASCRVVLFNVSLACSNPICHRSLRASGYTDEWHPFDWKLFV